MRKLFVAGNWKMNLDRAGACSLADSLAARAADTAKIDTAKIDLAVFPPYVYLDAVRQTVGNRPLAYGAQDVYFQPNGAFTGEVSTSMLADLGCRYVILGHSERRHVLGETNEDVNRKLLSALSAGLAPIVCLGELLSEREAGQTMDVIRRQVEGSLAGLSDDQMARVVLAYEPVWAIGTGKVATPEVAEEVHRDLRKLLADRYNAAIAQGVRIQYGGSVKAANAAQLLAQENVDGALVGGASLDAKEFWGIVEAALAQ